MKKNLSFFILLSLTVAAGWLWQNHQAPVDFNLPRQQAQFRSSQEDRQAVMKALNQQRRLTESVPESFSPDLDLAVKAERET